MLDPFGPPHSAQPGKTVPGCALLPQALPEPLSGPQGLLMAALIAGWTANLSAPVRRHAHLLMVLTQRLFARATLAVGWRLTHSAELARRSLRFHRLSSLLVC